MPPLGRRAVRELVLVGLSLQRRSAYERVVVAGQSVQCALRAKLGMLAHDLGLTAQEIAALTAAGVIK